MHLHYMTANKSVFFSVCDDIYHCKGLLTHCKQQQQQYEEEYHKISNNLLVTVSNTGVEVPLIPVIFSEEYLLRRIPVVPRDLLFL